MRTGIYSFVMLFFLSPGAFSASLARRQVLNVPWGNAAGQVGRHLKAGVEDGNAGPVDFMIDKTEEVYVADLFNRRIDVFNARSDLDRIILLPDSKKDIIQSISAADQKVFALVLRGPGKPDAHVLEWDTSNKLVQDLSLKALGILLPLYLERSPEGDFFIQDNMSFITWRLDATGKILGQIPDDERLMGLASQGRYRFVVKDYTVQILSNDGQLLATYWGDKGHLQILGTDESGALYILYEKEQGHLGLDKLSPDGKRLVSITISDPFDKALLDPDRFFSFRPGRIAPDGTLYIMSEPTGSDFKIFAYTLSSE
jgi:hypothetical protein